MSVSMLKKIGLGVGGVVALVSGVVVGSAIENRKRQPQVKPERFNVIASKYDKEVGGTEHSIGLEDIRQRFLKKAQGRVLETCAGTGRNNSYYDGSKVKELTLVDNSKEMLAEAVKKPFSPGIEHVRILQAKDLSAFANDEFDTVVDTFGICSVEKPEDYLQEVRRVLKPGGLALFLEHGRVESSGPIAWLMNLWLDFRAPSHVNSFGCLWNREVGGLIEKAGFNIINKQTHHVGTCTEIEARK